MLLKSHFRLDCPKTILFPSQGIRINESRFGFLERPCAWGGNTIICNMCLGGVLYHDFGQRFDSPFINLMIPGTDFVNLLANFDDIYIYIYIYMESSKKVQYKRIIQ